MSAKLVQRVTLHSTRKSRTWSRVVAELKFPKEIQEGAYEEWNNAFLTIPPICSSSNGTSRIIHVAYEILLEIDPNGPAIDLCVSIPICFGTVPLRMDNETNPQEPQSNFGQQVFQSSYFEASDNQEIQPTTELKGDVVNMDQNFVPSYPFYKDFTVSK